MTRIRRGALILLLGIVTVTILPWATRGGGFYLPGTTNAVLSFIDDTHVEIVRYWPARPTDVAVAPFSPQFWDFCLPGMGAIMILLTAPLDLPPVWALANPEYFDPDAAARRVLPLILGRVSANVARIDNEQVRRQLTNSLLPGQPAYEQLKAAIGAEVRSMATYQKYGYAAFMFIKGGWFLWFPICETTIETVPEGYGIPHVR